MTEEIKNETTNAVLKEMIIGLTKITDERLSNLKDSLSEIKLLMQGFATKIEVEEIKRDYNATIKRMEEAAMKHNEDDKISFGSLKIQMDSVKKTVYIGMGIVITVSVLAQIFIPIIIAHFWK